MSQPGTVYLIDDDQSVRRAMCRLLKLAGYRVVPLPSADAFLSLTEVQHPLCLVVDVRMPGATGFDLQNALRSGEHKLPIVLISGHGDADMAARAVSGGALAFLTKPVDDEALFEAVARGLQWDQSRSPEGSSPS